MDNSRYLDCLSSDYGDLRDAATAVELTSPVPSCPGWTVADLVFHVGEVYLHKAIVMRTGRWPDPWPPAGVADEAPLALLGRAYGELTASFAAREPASPSLTWYDPDQTVAFWIRRMAQETVIHRIDAEDLTDGAELERQEAVDQHHRDVTQHGAPSIAGMVRGRDPPWIAGAARGRDPPRCRVCQILWQDVSR